MKKVCFAINLYNHQGSKDTRIQFHPRKARYRHLKEQTQDKLAFGSFCCSLNGNDKGEEENVCKSRR
jgi:hypothetical protein